MKISKILSSKNWVAINLPLAKQLGLNAAFLFSHLCGLFEYYEARGELVEKESEMYFYATIDTIAENTPLSRREQDTAISILEKAGLLKKKSIGTPSKRHFTIPQSAEEILYNILQFGVFSQTSKAENAKQECNKTPNKNVIKRQTSKAKNANNIDKELYLTNNNTFSKEKDISEKTEVFFTPLENKKIIPIPNPKTVFLDNGETQTEKEKNCAKKEKDQEAKITIADINLLKGTFPFLQTVRQEMQDEFWAWLSVRMINKSTTPKFRIVKSRLEQLNKLSLQYTAPSIIKCLKEAQIGGKTGDGWVNPFAAEDKMTIKTQTKANVSNSQISNGKTDEQQRKEAMQWVIKQEAAAAKARAEKEAAENKKGKAEFERQQAAKAQFEQLKSQLQQQLRTEPQNSQPIAKPIPANFENENAIPLQQLISEGFSFEYKDEFEKANKAAELSKIYRFDEFAPQMSNLVSEAKRSEFIAKYITNKSRRSNEASLFMGAISFILKKN